MIAVGFEELRRFKLDVGELKSNPLALDSDLERRIE
jgi:hypothetical protein